MHVHGCYIDDSDAQNGAVRAKRSEAALVLEVLVGGLMMGQGQQQFGAAAFTPHVNSTDGKAFDSRA